MDAAHNVSPSFLRLKHIMGDQKATPPYPANHSNIKHGLVEWRKGRDLSKTYQTI